MKSIILGWSHAVLRQILAILKAFGAAHVCTHRTCHAAKHRRQRQSSQRVGVRVNELISRACLGDAFAGVPVQFDLLHDQVAHFPVWAAGDLAQHALHVFWVSVLRCCSLDGKPSDHTTCT